MASRLEQLNRIAVGILYLNLFAPRAYLHFISKTQTRLFQVSDASQANPAPEEAHGSIRLALVDGHRALVGTQMPQDRSRLT